MDSPLGNLIKGLEVLNPYLTGDYWSSVSNGFFVRLNTNEDLPNFMHKYLVSLGWSRYPSSASSYYFPGHSEHHSFKKESVND